MGRTFPMLREGGAATIYADDAIADKAGVATSYVGFVPNDEVRAFIITACNTHSAITVESARLTKARADLAEARLREFQAEPAPAEFGFYAGLAMDKLSVGPLPTFDAALEAARHEHGASKSIFVVEAKPAETNANVFGTVEIDRVLQWIEDTNAFPGGRDAVLPPIQRHHEDDLAKRLNKAVRQWMAANGINLITASLGEAKSHHVVIPHEVDSVTTRPVSIPAGIIATGQLAPGQGVKFSAHGNVVLTVADDGEPKPIREMSRVFVDEVDRWPKGFEPITVDADFPAWKRDIESTLTVSTPAGPHTGDMNAMLDDIGSASC